MNSKAERIAAFKGIDIYPVISSEFTCGRPVTDVLKAIADGGAGIVQLREKKQSKSDIYHLAEQYREITDRYNMLLIINDHLDIAMAVNADGVHLGQDDLPLDAAVNLNTEIILGNSTHNIEEALTAVNTGADYINIGPIFPTNTKNVTYPALGIEEMRQIARHVTIPFSVMGGIKEHHIAALLQAGARHIAMVTEITQAENITARVKALRSLWRQ